MKLDLLQESANISKFLADCAARYARAFSRTPEAATQFKLLSAIDLVYTCGAGAQVALNLDTRERYDPDGTWTNENYAILKCPVWEAAGAARVRGELELVFADGSNRVIGPDVGEQAYMAMIGDMLKQSLMASRDAGVFNILPRRERCELGVEELNGMYGWPTYENRGTNNLL